MRPAKSKDLRFRQLSLSQARDRSVVFALPLRVRTLEVINRAILEIKSAWQRIVGVDSCSCLKLALNRGAKSARYWLASLDNSQQAPNRPFQLILIAPVLTVGNYSG